MRGTLATIIGFYYQQTHERVLKLIDNLSDEQVAWRPAFDAHAIAWNLWHLARWADHVQAHIPRMTAALGQRLGASRQVWETENLAARWGFAAASLGYGDTGMLLDDEAARDLPLPGTEALLDDARRAVRPG